MIVGSGIDICENWRIRKLLNKHGDRFLNRVFIPDEIEYCMKKKDPVPSLAARFSVKEAFIKALGIRRTLSLSYKDIGLSGSVGKKNIIIVGKVHDLMQQKKVVNVQFSISHAKDYSCAVVILEA
ncbi:MAG: holo-[acyl-carrier-protein] synthase [Candidatus Hydrogenedentota bacterium]|nr:MAG: holo-[acyl-carrier-protein] synthase [Candidatus Hydrogenedentota bacterium]